MTVMVLPWPDRLDTDWIPPGPFRTAIWMIEKDPCGGNHGKHNFHAISMQLALQLTP
jgi:hypothetical protein